jgi:hypothetical protein
MAGKTDLLTVARANALFASDLSAWSGHSRAEVATAIRHAIHAHRGSRGCAGEVAAAYGERGETAAQRMRWALAVIEAFYSHSSCDPSAFRAGVTTIRPATRPMCQPGANRPDRMTGRTSSRRGPAEIGLYADRAEGTNSVAK